VVNIGIETFTAKTGLGCLNPQYLLLIPLGSLLSAPSLYRQVRAIIEQLFYIENYIFVIA
jgi:hypothetical protein